MSMHEVAMKFFDACETGKGWDLCKQWCHPDATFSCQADALADVNTLGTYTDWMAEALGALPDGHYELKSFAVDTDRSNVSAYAVFHGTNTGEGGSVPPTGNRIAVDFVYVMDFENGKICHMTKIWNDVQELKQLGWT